MHSPHLPARSRFGEGRVGTEECTQRKSKFWNCSVKYKLFFYCCRSLCLEGKSDILIQSYFHHHLSCYFVRNLLKIIAENDVTEKIVGSALKVHSMLGPGLLESAYKERLYYELMHSNIFVEKEKALCHSSIKTLN